MDKKRPALKVACPACGAVVNSNCVNLRIGKIYTKTVHPERLKAMAKPLTPPAKRVH